MLWNAWKQLSLPNWREQALLTCLSITKSAETTEITSYIFKIANQNQCNIDPCNLIYKENVSWGWELKSPDLTYVSSARLLNNIHKSLN